MLSQRTLGLVLLALSLGTLAGCPKESKSPPATGGSSSSGGAAAQPEKPAGKSVGKASQLTGTWFREGEGNVLGMEFSEDGKVLLTFDGSGGGILFDYAVMDGGRVRLTQQGGLTQTFKCNIDGSAMTFVPESAFEWSTSTFVKLAKGQTIADASRAKAQEAAKKQQELAAALTAYLSKPHMALVNADPKMHLDRMALELTGSGGSWSGTGYVEGVTVVARQVQLNVQPAGGPGQPAQIFVQFGNVVGPPGMHQMQPEQMTLAVGGTADKMEITGNGRALRPDDATFTELTEKYKKTAAEREAAMLKFADGFGAFCRLEGELRPQGQPAGQARRMALALLRAEGKPGFMWADVGRDPNPVASAFGQGALVMLDGDKPYLTFGQGVGALQGVDAGGKMEYRGQVQGMDAVFKVAESLTKDQIVKQRQVVTDFLDKQLPAGMMLRGVWTEDDRDIAPVRVVQFNLKGDGQRNLSGTYGAFWLPATCELTGKATDTLLGAKMEVDASKVIDDPGGYMRRGPVIVLSVLWKGGEPVITGAYKAGGSNGNHYDLKIATPESVKQDRKRLDEALAAGVQFGARKDASSSPGRPPSFDLKYESPGGKISGQGNYVGKQGPSPAPIAGTVEEKDGFVIVHLDQQASPALRRGAGKINLWVLPDAIPGWKGIYLCGYADWTGVNPRHPEGLTYIAEGK